MGFGMKEIETAFKHTTYSSRLRQLGRIGVEMSKRHEVVPILVEPEKLFIKSLRDDNTIVCLYVTWPYQTSSKTINKNPIIHFQVFRHSDSEYLNLDYEMDALEFIHGDTISFPSTINPFTGNIAELKFIEEKLEDVIIAYCGKKSV